MTARIQIKEIESVKTDTRPDLPCYRVTLAMRGCAPVELFFEKELDGRMQLDVACSIHGIVLAVLDRLDAGSDGGIASTLVDRRRADTVPG